MSPRNSKNTIVKKENFEQDPLRYSCLYNNSNCAFSSINHKELEAHINKYHKFDHTPYHCDLCDSKYTTYSNLQTHVRQNHLKSLIKTNSPACKYCGKKFKVNDNPKQLQHHERLHNSRSKSNNNIHVCVISKCKDYFSSSFALKHHVRLIHEEDISKCTKCNIVYANPKSLKRHIKDSHFERNPALKCNECPYIGRLPSDILLHMNKHSDEKRFKCFLCNSAYKNKCSLGFHMKKHTGENKHQCIICQKSFRQASLLRKHEETHSKIKLHSCRTCGTKFKQTYNLKYHEKHKCKRKLNMNKNDEKKLIESEIVLLENNNQCEGLFEMNSAITVDVLNTEASSAIYPKDFTDIVGAEESMNWTFDKVQYDISQEFAETESIQDLWINSEIFGEESNIFGELVEAGDFTSELLLPSDI